MSATTASPTATYSEDQMAEERVEKTQEWLRIGAGCTLLGGALLLLMGKRRVGLLVTAAGTALTMLDQKETVQEWWSVLPGYVESTQHMLDEAQHTIDDIIAKRDKLKSLLG